MKPQEFKNIWTNISKPLSPLTLARLHRFNLSKPTIDFLTIAGLPIHAQPDLSFAKDIDDTFYGINKLTDQYHFLNDDPEYEKYIVIGSCRDGDAIAIDTDTQDQIVQLDHEDGFRPANFNSTIETLADFLILFRDFESEVLKDKKSEESFQFFNFTNAQFDDLKNKMLISDSKAVTEKGFWKDELEILLSIRQECFGKK